MKAESRVISREVWPELPYEAWKDTLDTLHMKLQIVGDLVDHQVVIGTVGGETRRVALITRPVADFYAEFMSNLSALGIHADFRPIPDEVSEPIPFAEDTAHASYEPEWANRFWRVLLQADLVLKEHRSRFRGRTSPVHFFWGTFDLANTRYSGRAVTPPPGVGRIERLGGDAEVACAGFWPGSARYPRPAFYAYTYPKPDGIEKQVIAPAQAGWSLEIGEFALPYDDVRTSASPREAILQFFESTYEAGARLGDWDPSLVVR